MNSSQDPMNPDPGNTTADDAGTDRDQTRAVDEYGHSAPPVDKAGQGDARTAEIRHDRWVTMPPEGWVDGAGRQAADHTETAKPRSLSDSLSSGSGEILSSRPPSEAVPPPPTAVDVSAAAASAGQRMQPPAAAAATAAMPAATPTTNPASATTAAPARGPYQQTVPAHRESYYQEAYSGGTYYEEDRRRFYWSLKILRDIVLPLLIAFVVAMFAQATVAKPYQIPSGSMLPTIQLQDRILANRIVYRLHGVERGDVIVFTPPAGVEQGTPYVKRVIGLPGDTIEIRSGKTKVNGEDFVVPSASTPIYTRSKEVVPDGMLFVLGDNRNESSDSHIWGFVPVDNVIGRADVVYWPPKDMRLLGM